MMMKVKQHQQISTVEKKQSNNNDSRSSTMTMASTTYSKVTNNKRSSSTTTTAAGSILSNATPERLESSAVMLLDDNNDDDKFKKIEMDFNDALFMPKNDLLEFPPIDDESNSIKLDKIMSLASPASQFEPRKVSITSNKSTLDDINLLNDELNLEDIFPKLTDDHGNNNNDDDNNSNINHDDSFTLASFNDSSTAVDRLFMDDSDRSMDKILDDIVDVDEKINTTAKADFFPSFNSNSNKKDSMLKSIVDDKLSQLPQNNSMEQFNKLEQEKKKLLRRLMHIEQKSSSENMATKMGMGANNNIQQTTPTPMVVNSNNTNSNSMSSMNYYYDINDSNKNNTNSDNGTAETPLQNFLRGSKETSARRRNSIGAMTSSSCAATNNLPLHTPYTTTAMANQQDRRRIMRRNSLNAALGGSYQSAGMVLTSSKDHHQQHRIGAGAAKVQNRRISLSRSNSSGFGSSFSSLKYNSNKKNKKKNGSKKDLLDKGSSHSHRSIGSNDSGLFPTKRRGSCGSSHGLMGGGGAKYKLGGGGSVASRLGMVPYMITTTPAATMNNNGIIYGGNQQQDYQQQNDNGWPVESSSGSIALNMLM